MGWTDHRPVTAYKLQAPCASCGGEVWHGIIDEQKNTYGDACIDCGKVPAPETFITDDAGVVHLTLAGAEKLLRVVDAGPDAANKTQAVQEGYSHSFPPRFEEER